MVLLDCLVQRDDCKMEMKAFRECARKEKVKRFVLQECPVPSPLQQESPAKAKAAKSEPQ